MVKDRDVALVVIGNVTDVAPEGTTTLAGTVTSLGTPDDRLTVHPFAGAEVFRVIVPVVFAPADIVVGLTIKFVIPQLRTVTFALCQMTESWALIR